MSVTKQYIGLHKVFKKYWSVYGKWRALLCSPFLHASTFLTILCAPMWWNANWWERSLGIVPSILGFSIAGFALLLGVGTDRFKLLIATRDPKKAYSTLTTTSASFFHFILLQVASVVIALIASGRPIAWLADLFPYLNLRSSLILLIASKTFRFMGFFLLSYALLTSVAASLSIFRLSTVFSKFASLQQRGTQNDVQ